MSQLDEDTERRRIRAARAIHEQARQFRGRFLNTMAVIERDIGEILTSYFCRDDEAKKSLFFQRIARRMTLTQKREVLLEIVKADYPRFWVRNGPTLKNLQAIQQFRNQLAHSVVDVSAEALERPIAEGIGFVQWEGARPVSEQESQEWGARANMVGQVLRSLRVLLPMVEKPPAEGELEEIRKSLPNPPLHTDGATRRR